MLLEKMLPRTNEVKLTEALAELQQPQCVVDLGVNVVGHDVVEVHQPCAGRLAKVQETGQLEEIGCNGESFTNEESKDESMLFYKLVLSRFLKIENRVYNVINDSYIDR